MSLYIALKDAKNHSQRLIRFAKRNPTRRIIAYSDDPAMTLEKLKRTPLKKLTLEVAYIENDKLRRKGFAKDREITGRHLGQLVHGWGVDRCLIMRPRWFIDVTDKFIKQYNKVGPCAFSDGYHEFENLTKRTRKCKHCGHKEKLVTRVKKYTEWV